MATWIPWEEIRAELMKDPEIAENYEKEHAEFVRGLEAEIALYGTIANPKPTPPAARARALFPRRQDRVREKTKLAFTPQRKRVTA